MPARANGAFTSSIHSGLRVQEGIRFRNEDRYHVLFRHSAAIPAAIAISSNSSLGNRVNMMIGVWGSILLE